MSRKNEATIPTTKCWICGRKIDKHECYRMQVKRYDLGRYKQFSDTDIRYDLCDKHYRWLVRCMKALRIKRYQDNEENEAV